MSKVYTIDEIAKKLGASYHTIFNEIHRGRLKAIKVGRVYRITPTDLIRYLGDEARYKDLFELKRSTQEKGKKKEIKVSSYNLEAKEKLSREEYKKDPFFELGTQETRSGIGDLARRHDKYLYEEKN